MNPMVAIRPEEVDGMARRLRVSCIEPRPRAAYEEWIERCYATGFAYGWDLHCALPQPKYFAVTMIEASSALGMIVRCDAPWRSPNFALHDVEMPGGGNAHTMMRKHPELVTPLAWGYEPSRNLVPRGKTLADVLREVIGA